MDWQQPRETSVCQPGTNNAGRAFGVTSLGYRNQFYAVWRAGEVASSQLYSFVVKAEKKFKQFQQYFKNQQDKFLRTRIMENIFLVHIKRSSLLPYCFRDGSWYLAGECPHVRNLLFSCLLTIEHFEKVLNCCDSSVNVHSIKTCQSLVPIFPGNLICSKHICCLSGDVGTKSPAAAASGWCRLCGTWHESWE